MATQRTSRSETTRPKATHRRTTAASRTTEPESTRAAASKVIEDVNTLVDDTTTAARQAKGEVTSAIADLPVTRERAAQYFKERSGAEMLADAQQFVREHPLQGVAGAVAAGFIVGRIIR